MTEAEIAVAIDQLRRASEMVAHITQPIGESFQRCSHITQDEKIALTNL